MSTYYNAMIDKAVSNSDCNIHILTPALKTPKFVIPENSVLFCTAIDNVPHFYERFSDIIPINITMIPPSKSPNYYVIGLGKTRFVVDSTGMRDECKSFEDVFENLRNRGIEII